MHITLVTVRIAARRRHRCEQCTPAPHKAQLEAPALLLQAPRPDPGPGLAQVSSLGVASEPGVRLPLTPTLSPSWQNQCGFCGGQQVAYYILSSFLLCTAVLALWLWTGGTSILGPGLCAQDLGVLSSRRQMTDDRGARGCSHMTPGDPWQDVTGLPVGTVCPVIGGQGWHPLFCNWRTLCCRGHVGLPPALCQRPEPCALSATTKILCGNPFADELGKQKHMTKNRASIRQTPGSLGSFSLHVLVTETSPQA